LWSIILISESGIFFLGFGFNQYRTSNTVHMQSVIEVIGESVTAFANRWIVHRFLIAAFVAYHVACDFAGETTPIERSCRNFGFPTSRQI
jgi:hypothetical protein